MMKNNKIIIALLLSAALLTACFDKHNFDFSQLESIDAEGTWGIPLVNASYTIGDILAMTDTPDHLTTGEDGVLQIEYSFSKDSLLSASKFMNDLLEDVHFSGGLTFPTFELPISEGTNLSLYKDTIEVSFPDDEVLVSSATLKSGLLSLSIDYNLTHEVSVTVGCPQLHTGDGLPFHLEAVSTGGHYELSLNIANYILTPTNNSIEISFEVAYTSDGSPLPEQLVFNYDASLQNICFHEIRGKFATIELPLDLNTNLNLEYLAEHLAGSIEILDPIIALEIMNTFPVDAKVDLNEASLNGPGISSSLLASTPTTVWLPANTGTYTDVPFPIASHITITPNIQSFNLSGEAAVNTSGMAGPILVINEDQIIQMRFKVTLPIKMRVDHLTFCDTLDMGHIEIPDVNGFSNILLRLGIHNGLPLTFAAQAYFYDSQTHTVKDSLFTQYQPVLCAVNGVERLTELYVEKDNLEEVQRLLNCDKIIVRAMLDTEGKPAAICADQKLRVQLGARFNMDVNSLVSINN